MLFPPDITPPAVSLTSPAAGQTVSGAITATATASDNVGVAGVQFLVDGQNYGAEDTSAPYSVPVNTLTLANGAHTIAARARDAAGNTTTSAAVTVTVTNADLTAPAVSVTSPAAGQTVSGAITATATASDNVGVAGVQFLVDGQNYGAEDTSAPYSVPVNTLTLANGAHTIAARARDAAGNLTASAAVTFTVSNVSRPPGLPGKVGTFNSGSWRLDSDGNGSYQAGVDSNIFLGWSGATHFTGDWNGDGKTEVGVYSNGYWYLDFDGNGVWDNGVRDRLVPWGWAGVTPLVGDWNGDGRSKIGVYAGGYWYLDYDGNTLWQYPAVDRVWAMGWTGTTPVIGDWNGDGTSKAGAFINGNWYLDYNGNGAFDGAERDRIYAFGASGDIVPAPPEMETGRFP